MKSEKWNEILEHEDLKMYGFDERLEQSNIVYPPPPPHSDNFLLSHSKLYVKILIRKMSKLKEFFKIIRLVKK